MTSRTKTRAMLCVCVLLILSGCASRLPTYPAMSDESALRIVAARASSVTSISSSAHLTLTDEHGETVSFDAALVAEPPRRARLRAWKFGTPVMDLTILPEGVWAYVASRGGAPSPVEIASLPAAGIAQAVEMLSDTYFLGARALPEESTRATMMIVGDAFNRDDVRCEIDRATLTPRRFMIGDASGSLMEFTLDRYALVGDIAWARRWTFIAPEGRVVLQLAEIELNAPPDEAAFSPPLRATRLP